MAGLSRAARLRYGRNARGRRATEALIRPRRSAAVSIVRTRRIIDNAGADAVLAAAERTAAAGGHRVVIAVVDPWGELIALRRTPGAQVASSRVAVDKARTAAIFVRPSRELEQQVSGGRLGALALHGASCLTGGIQSVVDGEVVGAIGTSGETTDKARTAAIYRRPSKDFEDQASNGRPSALHLARAVPLQGGVPIEVDGHVIGAAAVAA